jgi:hypothetical protein
VTGQRMDQRMGPNLRGAGTSTEPRFLKYMHVHRSMLVNIGTVRDGKESIQGGMWTVRRSQLHPSDWFVRAPSVMDPIDGIYLGQEINIVHSKTVREQ